MLELLVWFGRAESFRRRHRRRCYNASLTSVGGKKGKCVAVNSNVRCKHNIAGRVQESQWCPFWLSPGLTSPGRFFLYYVEVIHDHGPHVHEVFLSSEWAGRQLFCALERNDRYGTRSAFTTKTLNEHRADLWDLGGIWCWQKLWWWQQEAGNMLPSMHQRELAIDWLPYKFII